MAEIPLPGQDSIEAQREMFRRAERECGLSVQIIANRPSLEQARASIDALLGKMRIVA